jgi:poly-gamma-glutamate synthesis protein (capsule biosynthesis protein)
VILTLLLACSPPPPAPPPVVEVAPPPAPDVPAPLEVGWSSAVRPLTEAERAEMTGTVWRPGCPVGLEDLRVIEIAHHRPAGGAARGEVVVHVDHADGVAGVFHALWDAGFPLTSARPMQHFGGDDDASMAADNTSGFNCRPAPTGDWSAHALGLAIDVNPLRNPFVRGERVEPEGGREFLARDGRPGVIVADGPVVAAFRNIGWRWGGSWQTWKDYQHFSATGR